MIECKRFVTLSTAVANRWTKKKTKVMRKASPCHERDLGLVLLSSSGKQRVSDGMQEGQERPRQRPLA